MVELRAALMVAEQRFLDATLNGTLQERQLAEATFRAAHEKVYGPPKAHALPKRPR